MSQIQQKKVKTRFAPSPTGFLHIGGARTALYSYLEAKRQGGDFVLRIEDTDIKRLNTEAVNAIIEAMDWLGLKSDEDVVFQTERQQRYLDVANQLLKEGKAYYAYETKEEIDAMRKDAEDKGEKPRYNRHYRDLTNVPEDTSNRVIRFKNPLDGSVVFEDKVKGRIEISNKELDDFVMIRPDGWPTYNFAVVVDDMDMGITEVIRGDDHVNNTPRQINLYQALGVEVPNFAHIPMILDKDGKKLSKRTNAVSVMEYKNDGYLPHAVLNYLVRLGWSHGDQEIFSMDDLIKSFDISHANKAPSRFDTEKLNWLNQHYIKTLDPASFVDEFTYQLDKANIDYSSGPDSKDVIFALKERVHTLREMAEMSKMWYLPISSYDEKAVNKHLKNDVAVAVLDKADKLLKIVDWTPVHIHEVINQITEELNVGMGKVAQPLRVAMTGTQISPSIDQTIYLNGRTEAMKRIQDALKLCGVEVKDKERDVKRNKLSM